MPDNLVFVFGICFLLAHEMDAVRCREWRILPLLNRLGEEAGYRAFLLLHIPLYALLLWVPFGGGDLSRSVVVALDVFLVVHAWLHIALRDLPENHFGSALSRALFLGAGMFGAIDLVLML